MFRRWKLCEPKGKITPVGPNFIRSKKYEIGVDDSIISFEAPKHSPADGSIPVFPQKAYNLEKINFKKLFKDKQSVHNFVSHGIFSHAWAFYGPWFTGARAQLMMSVELIQSVEYKVNGFSLYHPRAFEKVVGDYLEHLYSRYQEHLHNRYHYIAPIDWHPIKNFPVVAVTFKVQVDREVTDGEDMYNVIFPISDKIMAVFYFKQSLLSIKPLRELEEQIDRTLMNELMDNVINSIELKLSPEAEKKKQKALEGLEDTSLIKDFRPIKWNEAVTGVQAPLIENS